MDLWANEEEQENKIIMTQIPRQRGKCTMPTPRSLHLTRTPGRQQSIVHEYQDEFIRSLEIEPGPLRRTLQVKSSSATTSEKQDESYCTHCIHGNAKKSLFWVFTAKNQRLFSRMTAKIVFFGCANQMTPRGSEWRREPGADAPLSALRGQRQRRFSRFT